MVSEIINLIREEAHRKRCSGLRAFVSSTFLDLWEERRAVKNAIETCECHARLAEVGSSLPGGSLEKQISYWLRDIDVLVLLVADRYGSASPSGHSWTEKEVRQAAKLPIWVLPYFVSHDLPGGIEFDEQKQRRLDEFKAYLHSLPGKKPVLAQIPQHADGITDLVIRVARDIGAIQSDVLVTNVIERVLQSERKRAWEEARNQRNSYHDSFID